ncbi:MAG: ABC transporter permease subunit [Nakamurella sp.]
MTGSRRTIRSGEPDGALRTSGRSGFSTLLRSEWTKFVTVRGWLVGLLVAALVTILIGTVSALGGNLECTGPDGQICAAHVPPLDASGAAVPDSFTFVHRPLDGDGSLTVRLDALTGDGGALHDWAKAGIIVKQNATAGSPYAAMMMTGDHGVRLQDNYFGDRAGPAISVSDGLPVWLRLTRVGDELTGSVSADGSTWSQVGTATVSGLPGSVLIGMFVASPEQIQTTQRFGGSDSSGGPTRATAVFDTISGQGALGDWTGTRIGGSAGDPEPVADFAENGGTFTMTGSGDIAPSVAGPEGNTVERSLVGVFAGLIVMIVIGSLFITAEYRKGMIRTTFAAEPRRVRVLVAKAVVLGGVSFAVGLVASAFAFWLVGSIEQSNGKYLLPVPVLTQLRVIAGTAALLALSAVLALAVGIMVRRAAGTVAAVTLLAVVPYILAVASILPAGPAEWLLRVTPAAGFAIQQSTSQYPQVEAAYFPSTGFFPLAPWAGFAVLVGWTVLALGLAALVVRRRDVS